MNRYLTIYIPKTAVPAPVSRFLRTQAGLTKKQISQAKFRPGGIRKNGQQCRVTETAYPGDQIIVCLEADDVDSTQLESSSFTVNLSNHNFQFSADAISYSDSATSEFAGSDVNSHIYHSLSATSQFLPELAIIYEDQDILAINKPAGIVTHPSVLTTVTVSPTRWLPISVPKESLPKSGLSDDWIKKPPVSCSLPGTRLLPPDYRTSVKKGFQRKPIWLQFPVSCLWMKMELFTGSPFPLHLTRITV